MSDEIKMTHRVVSWDWAGQPDIEAIAAEIKTVFEESGGKDFPSVKMADTQSDQYAVVITSRPVSDHIAQELYFAWPSQ